VRDSLEKEMNRLVKFPGIGHLRLDLADARHRFWLVHPYLIVYRAHITPIEVIRTIHSARDFPALD
jgi:plasmid stabilization system protein ParE